MGKSIPNFIETIHPSDPRDSLTPKQSESTSNRTKTYHNQIAEIH